MKLVKTNDWAQQREADDEQDGRELWKSWKNTGLAQVGRHNPVERDGRGL